MCSDRGTRPNHFVSFSKSHQNPIGDPRGPTIPPQWRAETRFVFICIVIWMLRSNQKGIKSLFNWCILQNGWVDKEIHGSKSGNMGTEKKRPCLIQTNSRKEIFCLRVKEFHISSILSWYILMRQAGSGPYLIRGELRPMIPTWGPLCNRVWPIYQISTQKSCISIQDLASIDS